MRASLFCAIALALSGGYAMAAGTFTDVGLPGAQLTGLSHNGRVAAGSAGAAGWRWNKDRGVVLLDGFTSANGMNSWGQPVAGSTVDGDGNTIAALAFSNFDVAGGPVPVGGYPGGAPQDAFLSSAYDASDDGVVVGLALDDASRYFAFRWTAAEGMTQLTVNRPANASRANAVSADGSTIIGWNDQDSGFRSGVIWQNGVPLDLADADGNPVGEALAVSSDGSVVVGTGYSNPDTGGIEAWRWTAATGVQGIGCIDDFGCGHSSLAALSKLPFDVIKIDQQFVRALERGDTQAAAIIEMILALARTLNMEVVAEGIERREDMEFMAARGCHWIQGFLYGAAVSAPEFAELLRRQGGEEIFGEDAA